MKKYSKTLGYEVYNADQFREITEQPEDPSVKDHVSSTPQPFQKEIVDYLKRKGTLYLVGMGRAIDVFTGKLFSHTFLAYTDGTYSWDDRLTYYVEHYNLRPSDGFAEYVIEKLGLNETE